MPILPTNINPKSDEYRRNHDAYTRLLDEFHARQEQTRQGGNERARQRHVARGKLLPRDRVELLLDPGAPFLELSTLAAWGMYNDESPAASGVNGIGVISGVECMVSANDATAKGGASYPVSVKKALRAQEIAATNHLPCVYLVESAGANLLYQAEFFADVGGRTFANEARMSAAGIPQIALVFGNSTAGGAYVPGLSDYTVMVKRQAKVFLGGPPLVKMATGEEVDDESLGGAEMHTRVSGLGDYLAEDDADAIRIGREIVGRLNWRKQIRAALATPEEPLYDPDELLGIVPDDSRKPLEMREVIARLVDGSRFEEFKRDFGPTLVCGHAHLGGFPVGILGNNGVLFSDSAMKAAQFIQLCNQSRTPLLYLQNITGFMVGRKYEEEGIIKHGAKMVNAVANSTVPQFTVIVGGSYGAGNYGMCGRAYDPRLLFTWPNSRIAVMGAEQAAGVLAIVQEDAARARGVEPDAAHIEMARMMVKQKFDEEASPYYATARLWDDGILDPRETRQALIVGLSMSYNRDWVSEGAPRYGVFRM
ncbi:MAG TPA: carboxyl transferase domain-containing protein [Ktedonobacterales bacterium]|nr:carboxyl transferase domain-containing protein [Ktedonobacterales bacterium]